MKNIFDYITENRRRLWTGFWQLADPKVWLASTVPMILAVCLSLKSDRSGNFSLFWCLLAVAGVYLIEIGKNAVNEYVDFKSGVDTYVDEEHRTDFSGGKKTIIQGKLTANEALVIGVATLMAAGGIGLLFVIFRWFDVIWIGLLGMFFAIFYSVPPFRFCYVGVGEFAVGVTFGPLIVMGMYGVMTLGWAWLPLVASLPIGFLIANVLVINEFPDYEADKKGGKRNLVVVLGKRKALVLYRTLFVFAYISVIGAGLFVRSWWWVMPLFTMPLAVKAVKNANNYYDDIPKLVKSNQLTVGVNALTGLFMSIATILT